jgi:hypothetical protein
MSPIAQMPRGGGDVLALGESVKAPSGGDADYRIVTKKREQTSEPRSTSSMRNPR